MMSSWFLKKKDFTFAFSPPCPASCHACIRHAHACFTCKHLHDSGRRDRPTLRRTTRLHFTCTGFVQCATLRCTLLLVESSCYPQIFLREFSTCFGALELRVLSAFLLGVRLSRISTLEQSEYCSDFHASQHLNKVNTVSRLSLRET